MWKIGLHATTAKAGSKEKQPTEKGKYSIDMFSKGTSEKLFEYCDFCKRDKHFYIVRMQSYLSHSSACIWCLIKSTSFAFIAFMQQKFI